MIYGVGTDIVEVARIRRVWSEYGVRFARRILGPNELVRFESTKDPVRFLALRFAAKEATSKALGTGFRRGVSPRRIEVVNDAAGKPDLQCHGAVAALFEEFRIAGSHISLSDERDYAIAFVVLETA
ncbi:MAG: holo-ACP synthase [Gammaproteobacteria bacterium]|nr:holo-ACP synthase [Gammaproteobacteria bacterium]MBI5614756.1 holo-ACP synthase [Gammaproteobacteria bacterium]